MTTPTKTLRIIQSTVLTTKWIATNTNTNIAIMEETVAMEEMDEMDATEETEETDASSM
jgi:hypothetical protein